MSEQVANLIAVVAPHVLWLVFFSIVLLLIGRTRIQDIFSRLSRIEMKIFKSLGATVDLARSDKQALERLQGAVYDIVLSDVGREGKEDAGFKFFPELQKAILNPPVIFYTMGKTAPKPEGVYGITTRPDELMQLVTDALLSISKR